MQKMKTQSRHITNLFEINPKFAWPWNNKAQVFVNQGRYDEAISAFDEAIRLDPRNALVWNNKGNALKAIGKTTEANAAFDNANEPGLEN